MSYARSRFHRLVNLWTGGSARDQARGWGEQRGSGGATRDVPAPDSPAGPPPETQTRAGHPDSARAILTDMLTTLRQSYCLIADCPNPVAHVSSSGNPYCSQHRTLSTDYRWRPSLADGIRDAAMAIDAVVPLELLRVWGDGTVAVPVPLLRDLRRALTGVDPTFGEVLGGRA